MTQFTLTRVNVSIRSARYCHVITDEQGTQYGPTFGDASGPREAAPWLIALEQAYALGEAAGSAECAQDDDYTPGAPKCNEHLMRDLMNYSPAGALCQGFILQAVRAYAEKVIQAGPQQCDTPMVSGAAWVKCAEHIKATADAFYSR